MTGQTEAKRCSKCKRKLSLDMFWKDKNYRDGLCLQCKKCKIATRKKWIKSKGGKRIIKCWSEKYYHSEKGKVCRRNHYLQRNYNITLEQYDELLEQQNGVCAICKNPETAKNQFGVLRLAVDHNHKTRKVRGLLCQRCNFVIGHSYEDVSILLEAAIYIEKNR